VLIGRKKNAFIEPLLGGSFYLSTCFQSLLNMIDAFSEAPEFLVLEKMAGDIV
jgi:hypothetical protein